MAPTSARWLAEKVAREKHANVSFSTEGGPAILEIDLPDDLGLVAPLGVLQPNKALNMGPEITFDPGGGLEELQEAWYSLTTRIIDL